MAIQNTFYLDVDIKRDNYVDEPKVTQNDAVTFVLRLTDDGVDYPLTGVSTYTLASLRPDGQSVLTVGTLTAPNEITFELGSTEVSVPGNVKAAIQLYDADGRVSSIPFTYEVTKDIAVDYIPSAEEETLIQLVLGDGPAILNAAELVTEEANEFLVNNVRKGDYDNAVTYVEGNEVGFEGSSYVALGPTQGNLPTDTTFWALRARKGLGDVNSVNGVLPDGTGDVTLDMSDYATNEYVDSTIDRFNGYPVNVKYFGAVGDGIADDTLAIQNSLDYANVNKMSLVLPKGDYNYSSNLTVQGDIKSIVGLGEVKLNQIGVGYVGISVNATQNLFVENILFTSDLLNESPIVWLEGTFNTKINNCRFVDSGSSCVSLSKNENTSITNCYFKNTGMTAKTNPIHPSKPSIWVGESPTYTNKNVLIANCVFDKTNWSGVYFFAQGGTIRDCIFNSCGESSIFVDYDSRDINIINNKIDNSTAVNIAGFGIELGGVSKCLIDSNTITNCDEAGIALAKMQDYVISNNKCINNGKGIGSTEQKAGLLFRLISGNCIRGTITGNIFTDNRDTGKTQVYGISTKRYDETSYYIAETLFSNNYLDKNLSKPLLLVDEGTLIGDGNLFSNNLGYADRQKSIIIDIGTNTGLKEIIGIGFRPRHVRIEAYSIDSSGKSIAEIEMRGTGIAKTIVQYGNQIGSFELAWAIKDASGVTKNYADISASLNDGFSVNIGYAEVPVKLFITCYP